MLLMATFAILLHRYTGDEDIAVASALARRRKLAWQGVVGLLMNGVMLRAEVRDTDTCDAIIRRVRDAALQAYDNQDVPHSEVRRAVGAPESHEARARQVFFHSAPRVRPEFAGVTATFVPTATTCAKSDFGLSLFDETRDGRVRWHGEVEYNARLYEPSDIARILGDFERVLTRVCDDPGQTVAAATEGIPPGRSAAGERGGAEG
jgi:non-ribosomal peptide synthetase component F